MDNHTGQSKEELGYLFNVELLVKDEANALALQSLLEMLNDNDKIIDYRINSGIEIGQIIQSLTTERKQSFIPKPLKKPSKTDPVTGSAPADKKKTRAAAKPQPAEVKESGSFKDLASSEDFEAWIKKYISENKLVRLFINRNGNRVNIPCRILNFLPETYAINVYHVDEKQVYTFSLSEIIDFIDP